MQSRHCKHLRLRKQSKICIKCGEQINDVIIDKDYHLNQQMSIYEKLSLMSKTILRFEQQVKQNNKILLFLDIDDTILHCEPGIPNENCISGYIIREQFESLNQYYLLLKQYQYISFELCRLNINGQTSCSNYYFSIRPGFLDFILNNYQKLIILITTTGVYEYAKQICKILDPQNILFERITAREGQSTGGQQGIVVPDQSTILSQTQNQYLIDRNIKTIDIIKDSQILLNNYLIFDDSSFPWFNSNPPEQFFRSIPYTTSKITTNNDSFAQSFLPLTQERSFIAPFIDYAAYYEQQMLTLEYIINQDRRLSYYQGKVFRDCVFYFQRQCPSLYQEVNETNNEKLLMLQYIINETAQIDLRILTVWQFGGTVVNQFSNAVTHFVVNNKQSDQCVNYVNASWIKQDSPILTLKDKQEYAQKLLVSSDYIFISAFLLKRQNNSFLNQAVLSNFQ
ncbi:NLI interacting factor-like phosphatase domain-containing protein [Spironucleus salmonicida]|uniref:protein-serine/threonine phosphatase n=1 Tax=Spironucleus salmonicida TaxID=348837 RepID=V6LCM5_9EUKA|nr:NLI interacting factor-like phosphatase domain-containing protein [Spironucleus salmonicida]|eukprot:EST42197.1 Hypothetical protein SS50377_18500 [Spironucleus salmonicida]